MWGVKFGASRGLRWGALGLITVLICVAVDGDQASARHRHRHYARHGHGGGHARVSYSPPYSDFVIDVNSGAVLHATNADALRHPASLTKMMTLYLLFERLEQGRIKLDSQIEISSHAAAQAPSKLGLRPGQTIAVEDAIKAVVTKSANDIAVAIGETLGGDEHTFAEMMTRKAHALGMSKTEYRNACGLPNDEQVTTARDQAVLARALQDRFPRYFRYFSTPSFTYRGESMRNHNHLLGRVEGVDGIKTGYIRASGFNLVTSVHRGDRRIVGVVFGGSSAGSRDARMRDLINQNIRVAATRRTAPLVAEGKETAPPTHGRVQTANALAGGLQAEAPYARAAAAPAAPAAPVAAAAPAHADPAPTNTIPKHVPSPTDPIRPVLVKTVTYKGGAMQMAALAPLPSAAAAPRPVASAAPAAPAAASAPVAPAAKAEPSPPPAPRPGVLGTLVVSADPAEREVARPAVAERAAPLAPPPHARGGWLIQVGAFDAESEARERLSSAQSQARSMLAGAEPYTERVVKGDKAMYRARFAGFDREQAQAACRHLKRSDIACMPLKN